MELTDKVVLVTGSSSGIGKAVAIECARRGAQVIVHYRKNKKGAEATLQEIEKHSSGQIFQADLSQPTEVKKLFVDIKKTYPALDALVNNAGEAAPGAFDNVELWKSQWEGTFMSQVYVTNEFLKGDSAKELRKIVNISSVYGISDMGNPDYAAYAAAKAAVNSFTSNAAKKFAPHVLVNAVAPGYTWTPNWEGTTPKDMETATSLTRIKRYVTPEEIASMVVELLGNDAVTGEIIRVDGGLHLSEIF